MEKCPFGQKKVICSAGIKNIEDKHDSRRPTHALEPPIKKQGDKRIAITDTLPY